MPTLEIRENPDLFRPNPGGQDLFMEDYTHRFLALCGGWLGGKSWAGARKLMNLHVLNAFDARGQPTYLKGMCIGQTYSLCGEINIPEIRKACDEMGLSHRFRNTQTEGRFFEFPELGTRKNPSRILLKSGDSPETINGFSVTHGWGDEAARWVQSEEDPTRDALIQARGRLRDPAGLATFLQLVLTFTHEGDETRVYKEFEEKPLPGHVLYRAGTFENPAARDFAETQKSILSPELAEQYLLGRATSRRGNRVYSGFNPDAFPDGNVDEKVVLDENLPLQLSIDFNIDPGMHGVVGQHFEDHDLLTAVHEFHGRSMSTEQMLEEFKVWVGANGGWKWPALEVFGDPAGKGRITFSGISTWQLVFDWFAENMPAVEIIPRVPRAHALVADRVNSQNSAFRAFDGKIHYRVHPRCVRLIDDYKRLKWDGNQINKKETKLSHASEAEGNRVVVIRPVVRAKMYELDAKTE